MARHRNVIEVSTGEGFPGIGAPDARVRQREDIPPGMRQARHEFSRERGADESLALGVAEVAGVFPDR